MLVVSKTHILNMALSHLGVSKEVQDQETENSIEARASRRHYDNDLETVLTAIPWPFATQFAALGLVEEDPNDEWDYSYRYPSDCVILRRILSGFRTDNQDSRVPFKIGRDDDGTLVYTDEEEAEAEYTYREEDPTRYPQDFVLALSYRHAASIASKVTGGDPFKLGDKCLQLYRITLSEAASNRTDEEQPDRNPDAEFIRARE